MTNGPPLRRVPMPRSLEENLPKSKYPIIRSNVNAEEPWRSGVPLAQGPKDFAALQAQYNQPIPKQKKEDYTLEYLLSVVGGIVVGGATYALFSPEVYRLLDQAANYIQNLFP